MSAMKMKVNPETTKISYHGSYPWYVPYRVTGGQSKGERGGTAFPHLLFLVYTVPPPEFEVYALIAC